jgi:uncharacterized membrane protein YcaP (DUF421 family)
MDSVLRALVVYGFLILLFRISGKRSWRRSPRSTWSWG